MSGLGICPVEIALLKQLRMCACAHEDNQTGFAAVIELISQQEVAADVTFPVSIPIAAQWMIESGAEVPYVGTACPRTSWSDADREWLEARGTHVQYRASLEMDLAAVDGVRTGGYYVKNIPTVLPNN